MSPTRRSFITAAAASLTAAAFTWPAATHAAEPVPPAIDRPVRLYATSPDGRAVGILTVHPDGRVTVSQGVDGPETAFAPDTVTTPGGFLLEALAAMRVQEGDPA